MDIEGIPNIDSFSDPWGSMTQQEEWALKRYFECIGTPDGEKAYQILLHIWKAKRDYLMSENPAL